MNADFTSAWQSSKTPRTQNGTQHHHPNQGPQQPQRFIEQLVQQRAELVLYRAVHPLPKLSPVPSVLLERLLPVPILQLLSGGLRQRIR